MVILSADANWFGDQVSRITPLGIIQWCQKVTTSAFWPCRVELAVFMKSADVNWFGDQVTRITPLGIIQWCQKVTTSAFCPCSVELVTTMNP